MVSPHPAPLPVIHDGDHGGDDFIATLVFAAHPEKFNLLGITTSFGNTSVENATRNARAALALAGRPDVPVYRGSDRPFVIPPKGGDAAFSENGLGGVEFPPSPQPPGQGDAVAWMAETLAASPEPVTLAVTGLMTDTARLLRDHPHIKSKIARIVAMGGCKGPLGIHRRHGNITEFAEFNFYMDPEAADFVLKSGIPLTLLPMDATHQCVLTPDRQKTMLDRLPPFPGQAIVQMIRAAEKYDTPKFGADGAFLHDEQVPLYLLAPHLYRAKPVSLTVDLTDPASPRHGQMHVSAPRGGNPVLLVQEIDADASFDLMVESLGRLFPQRDP